MLKKANQLLAKSGAANVSFVESPITDISLPDQTADCIISNCVINLVPESEKQLVFNECFRLLKSGGRFAVATSLPRRSCLRALRAAWLCMSAVLPVQARLPIMNGTCVRRDLKVAWTAPHRARLSHHADVLMQLDILIVDTNSDLNIYTTAASDGDGVGVVGECE